MHWRLRTRITLFAVLAVVLTIGLLLSLLRWEDEEMVKEVGEQWRAVTSTNMSTTVQDSQTLCLAANLSVERRLDVGLDRLRTWTTETDRFYWIEPGHEQTVRIDMGPGKAAVERTVMVPDVRWRAEDLGFVRDWDERGELVDDLQASSGAAFSIYARINEAGDMVCVASSARDTDGLRKTGLLLPSRLPDGSPDPRLMRILAGRPAIGLAMIDGEWELSKFEPLKNENGHAAGMVEVSMPIPAVDVVRDSLTKSRLGTAGYTWVVGGEGAQRGQYLLSHDERLLGSNMLNMRAEDGRLVGQAILAQALKLGAGETAFEEVNWKGPHDVHPRRQLIAFTYFAPWDWVIGVTMYEEDVEAAQRRVQSVMDQLFQHMIGAGLGVLCMVLILAVWMGRQLARPIEHMAQRASTIAAGDLRMADESLQRAKNGGILETVRLGSAFQKMTSALNLLIRQMQHSGTQVSNSGGKISSSTKQLEKMIEEQASATTRASTITRDISATSQELAQTMTRVVDSANSAARLADESRQELRVMEDHMEGLMDASGAIAAHLSAMSEKTGNIGGIVTAITKVADQTNILSVNAAIEAEKAGEYGRGFSVVSREIRSLADQTAVSSLHIERMVREMGSAVSSGVMEMDQFVEKVREGISSVQSIGIRLERLIAQVQELTPPLENVLSGMRNQSSGADNIREMLEQLSAVSGRTRDSIQELSSVSKYLSEAVSGLQREVSRFTTE